MNAPLSLPLMDRDTTMRRVAREIAMDLYPLDKILENVEVSFDEFSKWKDHPQFLKYLKQFRDEWSAASNTAERTKIKAGLVMEEFMEEAYKELHNIKQNLNHRVELGKLVAKIAGMGEPKFSGAAGGGTGFTLSINIGNVSDRITIQPEVRKVINHDPDDNGDFDTYDPFTSPNTLED